MAIVEGRIEVDDRRTPSASEGRVVDDRRSRTGSRRAAPRMKTFKGAKIVASGALSLNCIVRNVSKSGAQLEVLSSVGDDFELVFNDGMTPPQKCRVVWRNHPRIGVRFDRPGRGLGPIGRALSKLLHVDKAPAA